MGSVVALACGLWLLAIFLIPYVLMWAWNLVAPLFDGPQIEYWHAFAFYLIIGIISSPFRSVKNG